MSDLRRFDVDEMLHRPGTYVHPQTEIVVVVDDSAHVDAETLAGARGGGEWVLVSDEHPIDEHRRDELIEALEARAHRARIASDDLDDDEGEDADEADELDDHGFSTGEFDDEDDY